MSSRVQAGVRVRTAVELPVANCPNNPRVPIGTEGIVRRVFGDALGGFQVDLTIGDTITPAVLYDNQIVPVQVSEARTTGAKDAVTAATESSPAQPVASPANPPIRPRVRDANGTQ